MINVRYGASSYSLTSNFLRSFVRHNSFITAIRNERYSNNNKDKVKNESHEKVDRDVLESTNTRTSRRGKTDSETKHEEDGKNKPNVVKDIKDIIQKTKKAATADFFDPANINLDLTKDNATLYNKIQEDARSRMKKRYSNASGQWLKDFKRISRGISTNQAEDAAQEIQNKIMKSLNSATVSPTSASRPIGIGDLVLLSENSINLYLVASCPKGLSSNSYTFINHEGELIFGSKSLVRMRFPGIIPDDLAEVVESFVRLETKYMNVAPIGISNQEFSRSYGSLPIELQTKNEERCHDKQEGGTPSDIAGDFIVAQASSQLLTNSDVNTYHVPNKARLLYSEALAELAIKTFEDLPIVSTKLEILHRALQYDHSDDLLNSPRTVSTFELAKYVDMLNLDALKDISDEELFYKRVKEQLGFSNNDKSDETNLGRRYPEARHSNRINDESYPLPKFLAMMLSIRNQGRWWKLNKANASDSPSSVCILPIKHIRMISDFLVQMKDKKNEKHLLDYFLYKADIGPHVIKPDIYDDVIELLKNYISGNIHHDPEVETTIVKLIRLFDKHMTGLGESAVAVTGYTYDYSKAKAYDIFEIFQSSSTNKFIDNPFEWSYASQLPNVEFSSKLGQEYYDVIDDVYSKLKCNPSADSMDRSSADITGDDKVIPNSETRSLHQSFRDFYREDQFAAIREDFGDTPVYCIDSESAHEIDDGISIQENETDYRVSIHVANPTTYLKPFSILSQLAFSKGSTLYLPEGPIFMLPQTISQLAGLGEDGKVTRTFVVQYSIDKRLINEYIAKKMDNQDYRPPSELTQAIYNQIQTTSTVKLGKVKRFPQGFTYDRVNEVLNSPYNIDSFKKKNLTESHALNLFNLYYISTVLKDIRVNIGKGLDIDVSKSSLKVEFTKEEARFEEELQKTPTGYQLTINKDGFATSIEVQGDSHEAQESKSQLLVSHFMIFANYASSRFARKHDIPIIHRNQEMRLSKEVEKELANITTNSYRLGKSYTVEETDKILTYLSSAKYHIDARGHKSLGLGSYSTVTSPLRRFVDMANHWMFEGFLSQQPGTPFEKSQLSYISNHLQISELINKKVQHSSSKFWEGIFFKNYCSLLSKRKISPMRFKLLIKGSPMSGHVQVNVLGFNNLEARLEHNSMLRNKFLTGELEIGSTLDSADLNITRVDFIEDELVFELGPS